VTGAVLCAAAFAAALSVKFAPGLRANSAKLDAVQKAKLSELAVEIAPFIPIDNMDSVAVDACVTTSAVAHGGVDLVAYFSLPKDASPVPGSAGFAEIFNGYTYYFSSAANQALFAAQPSAYVPAWGGFCAYGVAKETFWTWPVVKSNGPRANNKVWRVYDVGGQQQLFFFMYALPIKVWEEANDVPGQVAMGNTVWANWTQGTFYSNTGCLWNSVECGYHDDDCVYS
jgi:YHS domain-containing protein